MTKELCSILKNRLADLPFLSTIAGLAQPVIDTRFTNEDVKIAKKMPVAYDFVGGENEIIGMERQLVPDEGGKAILYFEDFGTTQDTSPRARANSVSLITRVRVVCWLNKTKMVNYAYNEITAACSAQIIAALCLGNAISRNGISRLFVTMVGMPIQDIGIFSRYNYDEAELQFLRPPFEYFAIDLSCRYEVRQGCIKGVNLNAG